MKKVERSDKLEVISVYDLEEFSIGHASDMEAITGCTVIMANHLDGLVAGADVRGGAPGTGRRDCRPRLGRCLLRTGANALSPGCPSAKGAFSPG